MSQAAGGAGPLFDAPAWRYLLVGGLYGYQGVVAGFGLTALPNHHAALGAPPAEIGWHAAMLGLPWILQPLWGPVVDRFGDFRMGRRRFWVAAAMTGALAAPALLLALHGAEGEALPPLPAIGPVLLLHGVFATLLDTALDAMVIDHVPPNRLGRTNACSRAGFVSGTALGAVLFAWLLPAAGFGAAVLALLGFGGVAAGLPLVVREAPEDVRLSLRRDHSPRFREARGEPIGLLAALRTPGMAALLTFCIAQEFAGSAFGLRLGVTLVQAWGWDAAELSRMQGAAGFAAGTAGALAIGFCVDRAGILRSLAMLLGLCAAAHAVIAVALLSAPGEGVPPAGVGALAVTLNVATPALAFAALAPAVMTASRGPSAATRFALVMAALNAGGVTGAVVSGHLGAGLPLWAAALAAAAVFAACAALARQPHLLLGRVPP